MPSPLKSIISASRRTDIPAFYMDWFMRRLEKGFFTITNPFNQQKRQIQATPDSIHTIVFWSKNFGPFIEGEFGQRLMANGYHLFFNFSINSVSSLLEPGVPGLEERLTQLKTLASLFGPNVIHWRFDPICFYQPPSGPSRDNLSDFEQIASTAAECGITRCITSFMDDYRKIRRRVATRPGFDFIDPPLAKKTQILSDLAERLWLREIRLETCCEKSVLNASPNLQDIVTPASCIPSHRIAQIYGGRVSSQKDTGQRRQNGCGCRVSVDIGSYREHPCYHNCLFCYANPQPFT